MKILAFHASLSFFPLINYKLPLALRTSKKAHVKIYRCTLCVNFPKCYGAVFGEGGCVCVKKFLSAYYRRTCGTPKSKGGLHTTGQCLYLNPNGCWRTAVEQQPGLCGWITRNESSAGLVPYLCLTQTQDFVRYR